jgi:hypothetical protein
MKRHVPTALAVLAVLTLTAHAPAHGQTATRQTTSASPSFGLTKVTAQTLAGLGTGTKYVADLSRSGIAYEFSPAAGPIDLNRVVVHTARGDMGIGSWLAVSFPSRALTGLSTQGFQIGAAADLRKLRRQVGRRRQTAQPRLRRRGYCYCTTGSRPSLSGSATARDGCNPDLSVQLQVAQIAP